MDKISYYAVYTAQNATATRSLATKGQDRNHFPPNISYGGLVYVLSRVMQVSTPTQEESFRQYCKLNNILLDIEIYG